MSIKLPAAMVFYGELENRPHALLWWIPAEVYPSVAKDERSLVDLQANHPNGIEVEVQDEVLAEAGVTISQWEVTAPELRSAFLKIHSEGKLPSTGLIQAENLIQIAKLHNQQKDKSIKDLFAMPNQPFSFSGPSEMSLESEDQLQENPDMTSGEDAEDFFRRISGI